MGKVLGKVLGAPSALLRKVAETLVIRWLRAAYEGRHGTALQSALLYVKGRKTWFGFIIGLAGYVTDVILPEGGVGQWAMLLGSVLFGAGLIDKAVWEPGRPEVLANLPIYRFLADNAGSLAAALTAGLAWVAGTECTNLDLRLFTVSCTVQFKVLLGTAAALVYVGILDVGFLSRVPRPVLRRDVQTTE